MRNTAIVIDYHIDQPITDNQPSTAHDEAMSNHYQLLVTSIGLLFSLSAESDITPDFTAINYGNQHNPAQVLDLYLPKDTDAPYPVVLYLHPGGWSGGSRASKKTPTFLTKYGFALVAADYRLTNEAIWPAQSHDIKGVVRWIRANAHQYGLDQQSIGAMGMSAGGHLATMLGVSQGIREFRSGTVSMDLEGEVGGNLDYDSNVQAVVNFYGPSDFLQMNKFPSRIDHDHQQSPESRLVGGAIQKHPDHCALANPMTYIDGNEAPILIIHGIADKLVPLNQSELLFQALKAQYPENGPEIEFIAVAGGGHNKSTETQENYQMVVQFFIRHLKQE